MVRVAPVIHLLDGPAKGSFGARRAPIWLRAVVNAEGKPDVLDLLDDTPRPDETVHVYRAVSGTTFMFRVRGFICADDGKGGYRQAFVPASGEYHHLPDVDGEALREFGAWREWVMAQPEVVA